MVWRVGGRGLRVFHGDGSETLLPPGSLISDIPDRFDGGLERVAVEQPGTYTDKKMHAAGDYEVK